MTRYPNTTPRPYRGRPSMTPDAKDALSRRGFLGAAGVLVVAFSSGIPKPAAAQTAGPPYPVVALGQVDS